MCFIRYLFSVVVCVLSLSVFADGEEALFKRILSNWVHKLTWSEKLGFSVELKTDNKPLVFRNNEVEPIEIKGIPVIRLKRGVVYLLTNGRGRSQTFQVEYNERFDQTVLLLTHEEGRKSGRMFSESHYSIISCGSVYNDVSNFLFKLSFPLILPDALSTQERLRETVDGAAHLCAMIAKEERTCAIDFIRNNPTELELAVGVTNNVCYSKIVPQTAEDILGMVQPGKSSKVLERLLADMPKKRGGGVEKWGRVCRTSRGSVVVGISLLNFGVSEKYFSFYETGNLNFMLERWRTTGRVIVRHYNPHGSLDWMVRSEEAKVVEYWRREDGELDEMKVDSTTHSLFEEAYKTFSGYKGLQKSVSSEG